MVGKGSRAAIISDRRVTGLSGEVIAELGVEVGLLWHERHQVRLESRPRKRAVGAGAMHRLVFVDGLLAALVHLRHGATHDVLACWFGVDRSTITVRQNPRATPPDSTFARQPSGSEAPTNAVIATKNRT
ncbi:helix-turn-helix domain-containing protein [Streptomyces sp. 3211]|uniref:helix-turn-helix domain-containing protein n=1 Tax=Streptomyces sp. 3211 TaxID=1964449 RepID=UPI0018166EC4